MRCDDGDAGWAGRTSPRDLQQEEQQQQQQKKKKKKKNKNKRSSGKRKEGRSKEKKQKKQKKKKRTERFGAVQGLFGLGWDGCSRVLMDRRRGDEETRRRCAEAPGRRRRITG
ncbi:hypothetical protein TESG_07990 [Trichophyton tonsurans CBS 112818]|uniref:Uncharacterized protein n=1 Tax=Trichophyton tonsurans (strain CBS 112818) TaxID=647933 RepID=F2SAU6_TRIT1|nr:hypothetical protein TESG_07990 [Trichophyton tonsurans CBS 112818]